MKRSNILYLLFAFVLVIGALIGCSSSDKENEENAASNENNESNEGTNNEEDAEKDPEDFEGDLEIWTFFGDVETMATEFEDRYPNVNVNVSVFPGDQYQTKLMNAINTKTDVPDIFDLERSYMGKFINEPFVADLSAMGIDEVIEDYVPYVKELGVGEDDSVRAVSDHSSPGAFWYHLDLAKEYLGTDDPDEISDMVSDWDKIIELGKEVQEDSDGEIHLISHFGDVFNTEVSNQEMWVQDDQLVIDPAWEDVFMNMKNVRDEGVDAKLGFFSAGWGDALNEGEVIMFAMPAWGGFMINNDDDAAKGKYGLAKTPSGYYDGGTYRAIYEGSDNKELAYEFVKFIAGEEWQQFNLEETGNMPAHQSLFDENSESFTHIFFGEQPVLDIYSELVNDIPAKKATASENDISTLFYDAANESVENGESYDDAIKRFKGLVKNGYPEIKVE